MFGIDRTAIVTANFPLDSIAGGLGAFPCATASTTAGDHGLDDEPFADVEQFEQEIPFLFLYRRESPTRAGHGRWRGGAHRLGDGRSRLDGAVHRVRRPAQSVTRASVCSAAGRRPAGTIGTRRTATSRSGSRRGDVPGNPDQLRAMAPHGGLAPPKKFDNRLIDGRLRGDANPGAGYGDPMTRDPELVVEDVRDGRLTPEHAQTVYGVTLDDVGELADGYDELRRARLAERLAAARPPLEPGTGSLAERHGLALATVAFGDGPDGEPALGCSACGQVLCAHTGNYRLGASRLELRPLELGTHFTDPLEQVGHELIWRSYLCPGVRRGDGRRVLPSRRRAALGREIGGEMSKARTSRAVVQTGRQAFEIHEFERIESVPTTRC